MPKYGMVIDLTRCMGCRACMEACKTENDTSENIFWMTVFRFQEDKYPKTKVGFLPRPCQHCDNAPCVEVCPTGARYKEDGITLVNFKKCIGCRYCEVACPYGVNFFNWKKPKDNYYYDWKGKDVEKDATKDAVPPWKNPALDKKYTSKNRLVAGSGHYKGVTEKCTFCVQKSTNGEDPACVQNCPVNALIFGDQEDPKSPVSEALSAKRSFQLKGELDTHPNVFYMGQPPPDDHAKEIEPVASKAKPVKK